MNSIQKQKNILDLFIFDLTTFFAGDYKEINSEEILNTVFIDYEKILPRKELDIFNRVIFRVFIEKTRLIGSNHINATFFADEGYCKENIINIIERITEITGIDDNRKGTWGEIDKENFKKGTINRTWTLGKNENIYSIRLHCNKEEVQLSILFLTNLLKHLNKI